MDGYFSIIVKTKVKIEWKCDHLENTHNVYEKRAQEARQKGGKIAIILPKWQNPQTYETLEKY